MVEGHLNLEQHNTVCYNASLYLLVRCYSDWALFWCSLCEAQAQLDHEMSPLAYGKNETLGENAAQAQA